MTNPNTAKREARGLERLVNEEGPSWPPELLALGKQAVNAAKALDQPRIEQIAPMLRDCGEIITKFADAYSAFIASQGAGP